MNDGQQAYQLYYTSRAGRKPDGSALPKWSDMTISARFVWDNATAVAQGFVKPAAFYND